MTPILLIMYWHSEKKIDVGLSSVVETTEQLFSFSYAFLLIICVFFILESVWKNLPCRQYYAAAQKKAVYFSLPFFWRNATCNTLGSLWVFMLTIFFLTQVLGLCPKVVCVWFLLQTRQAYHASCTCKAKAGLVAQCLCYGNRFITNSK